MTLEQAVSDVVELTGYLRDRFGERKIYLMGESWGTILGVLAVQARPDLYYAWIGSGQMVDVVDTDRRVYADLVAHAGRAGDEDLAAGLRAVGEPPYRGHPLGELACPRLVRVPVRAVHAVRRLPRAGRARGLDPFGMLGSEYDFIEKLNVLRGLVDTFTVLYPQLYDLDFRESATRLEVPVYVLDGSAELEGRRAIALEWFDRLEAPTKRLVSFDGAAHSVAFEQAERGAAAPRRDRHPERRPGFAPSSAIRAPFVARPRPSGGSASSRRSPRGSSARRPRRRRPTSGRGSMSIT